MKYFKKFNENKNVEDVCNKYNIKNWTIVDGKVNVNGDVNLNNKNLSSLDIFDDIPFGEISGSFYCVYNKLTSLQYAPTNVGGDYYCYNNQLTSLEGAPNNVGGNFICSSNQLTSLEGAPTSVSGDFSCGFNKLISLKYAPTSVGGHFFCSSNQLTSLKYAPTKVGGDFNCINNDILDFKYFPNVDRIMHINTQLKYLYDNFIKTNDKIQLFNEFNIIKDNTINLKRLNTFIQYYGGNEPNIDWLRQMGYKI